MREEGIERETMGARGTSRNTHTQTIIFPKAWTCIDNTHACKRMQVQTLHEVTHKPKCRKGILAIVKLYNFA